MLPLPSRTISHLPIILAIVLASCSGLEQSEREKIRRRNCTGETIYRSHNESFFPIRTPAHTPRHLYLWESEANLPRITKEYFRCKGSLLNPVFNENGESHADCDASLHGLPIIHGKEGIYPILTDLLNYIQKKTGRRVIITCGHRCPTHNIYSDSSKENRTSKHQIGAEVDFYVQAMEDRPLEIVGLVMQYYQETPIYQNQKDYQFIRYEKGDTKVQMAPWMNKEIFIKLHQKHEGRDKDNQHPHPYITLQVRYDKDRRDRVVYEWQKAHQGYPQSQK